MTALTTLACMITFLKSRTKYTSRWDYKSSNNRWRICGILHRTKTRERTRSRFNRYKRLFRVHTRNSENTSGAKTRKKDTTTPRIILEKSIRCSRPSRISHEKTSTPSRQKLRLWHSRNSKRVRIHKAIQTKKYYQRRPRTKLTKPSQRTRRSKKRPYHRRRNSWSWTCRRDCNTLPTKKPHDGAQQRVLMPTR